MRLSSPWKRSLEPLAARAFLLVLVGVLVTDYPAAFDWDYDDDENDWQSRLLK